MGSLASIQNDDTALDLPAIAPADFGADSMLVGAAMLPLLARLLPEPGRADWRRQLLIITSHQGAFANFRLESASSNPPRTNANATIFQDGRLSASQSDEAAIPKTGASRASGATDADG